MTEPAIAVILLNWNGKADTLACLESLRAVSYPHLDIFVVDNASTDGSYQDIASRFPEVTLLVNSENLGFAEGNNVGIRKALEKGAELIFLLNNDTVVDPGIFEAFVALFQRYPRAGILGAKICLFGERKKLDHLGGMWNAKKAAFVFVGLREEASLFHTPQEIEYVCGAGMMVRREVFERIGLLEPRYFLIWEEADFCFRARRAGFSVMTAPEAVLWHKVSASFVGGKPHSTYFWWRNRLLWIERNCTLKEQMRIYFLLLLPAILHMVKIHCIKSVQLALLKWMRSKKNLQQKEEKLFKNRAALAGVRDYCLRRFGNCPSWLVRLK